jgi:hypothetical protein
VPKAATRFLVRAVLVAAAAACPPAAQGQTAATSSVSADVFVSGARSALSANGISDLAFGLVNAGGVYTPPSLSDAGRFGIHGEPNTPVSVNFLLPSVLHGPGTATIPITFDGISGLHWIAFPSTNVRFDARASHVLTLDANGDLIIGVIGTITPPQSATTGAYTGLIVMLVSY